MDTHNRNLSWMNLFLITFLASYTYVFEEWLFIATKPSFLNNFGFPQQLLVFFTISAILYLVCLLGLFLLLLVSRLPGLKRHSTIFQRAGTLLPAVIIATTILLMVDNFTYTVFKFGIVSTDGFSRALYTLGFLVLVVLSYRRVSLGLADLSQKNRSLLGSPRWIAAPLTGVLLVPLAFLVFSGYTRASPAVENRAVNASQLPNIILVTSDGVEANHMSIYGYSRDTTPFMRQLSKSALVAENAFTNAAKTSGSIISIYTGKYPAQTRVLYPPDILKGTDSVEHLPAILRTLGYKTVQITTPHYIDANKFNLLNGFMDVKNSGILHSKYYKFIRKLLPYEDALFFDEISNRITDRFRHIFFIQKMDNPFLQVTGMSARLVDIDRLDYLTQEIIKAKQPLFVHVHLMVTHGKQLNPQVQVFSAGQSVYSQGEWNDDFYDDTILELDNDLRSLVATLNRRGLLDKTILFIGSDHGRNWTSLSRIPFILRFPNGEFAGKIHANVQNLDLAPTILDYLGIQQPAWMVGQSLIAPPLDERPIISVDATKQDEQSDGFMFVNPKDVSAPFYQFGEVTLIYCQKWYKLDLINLNWDFGNIAGSTLNCADNQPNLDRQVYQWIYEHLKQNGFDVSSLDKSVFKYRK